jgi:hypothetical protein
MKKLKKCEICMQYMQSEKKLAHKPFAASFLINPLKAKLNPICHLLALLGAHHILHVSGLRVKRRAENITPLP